MVSRQVEVLSTTDKTTEKGTYTISAEVKSLAGKLIIEYLAKDEVGVFTNQGKATGKKYILYNWTVEGEGKKGGS